MNDSKSLPAFTGFALLGSGQIAKHLQFYISSLNLPLHIWSRNGDSRFNSFTDSSSDARLEKTVAGASHILLAVRDEAIVELGARFLNQDKVLVHFSGALSLPYIGTAHPLMTFGPRLENLNWYKAIPFVIDEGETFQRLLPGLTNPHWAISPETRALYHALCSLAGNASFLMWKQVGDAFETKLNLPRGLLEPFLHQVVVNATHSAGNSFTGPVARQDWGTVQSHLSSLNRSPELLQAYRNYLGLATSSGIKVPEALL
jgi:predicted short-subunit dehydrogenase-like oxidoreductase (DUF2520 family)